MKAEYSKLFAARGAFAAATAKLEAVHPLRCIRCRSTNVLLFACCVGAIVVASAQPLGEVSMQEIGQPSPFAVARKVQQVLRSVIPFTLLFLPGCAVQHSYRFVPKSVTRISYDPKQCIELPDGRYKCKDVVFTVSEIEPLKTK